MSPTYAYERPSGDLIMMQKGHCIICHSDDVELTDEHVIPEALGGCYHSYNVCKSCNSILGSKVDAQLSKHIILRLCREKYQLKGKTGEIPSFFFDQPIHLEDNPNQQMQFYKDKNGEMRLKYKYLEEGEKTFSITMDGSEKKRIEQILKKKKQRIEKKGGKVVFSDPIEYLSEKAKIQGDLAIDLLKFKIGILKIAYESLCDLFPEYEKDEYAKKISDILINGKYKDVEQFVNIGNGFERLCVFDTFKVIHIDSENNHLIYFKYIGNIGLYCFISLFDTIFFGIKMSILNYLGNYCLYAITNDYCNKNFKKYRFGSNGLEKI